MHEEQGTAWQVTISFMQHQTFTTSVIVDHLIFSNHKVDPTDAFKVPMQATKRARKRSLATAEAKSMHLLKPTLCAQNNLCESYCCLTMDPIARTDRVLIGL